MILDLLLISGKMGLISMRLRLTRSRLYGFNTWFILKQGKLQAGN